jgi:hypothetical protein
MRQERHFIFGVEPFALRQPFGDVANGLRDGGSKRTWPRAHNNAT